MRSASEELLAAVGRGVGLLVDRFSVCSTFAKSGGLLTVQSFCGVSLIRAPFRSAALSEPRNVDAKPRPSRRAGKRTPERGFSPSKRRSPARRSADDPRRGPGPARSASPWDERAEIARDRTHVAVRELEPGAGERDPRTDRGSRKSPRNSYRRPGRTAARGPWSAWSARAFDGSCASGIVAPRSSPPLLSAAGLFVSSIQIEQIVEEVVAPLRRRL